MKKKERGKIREGENEGKKEECMQEDVHALYIHDTLEHLRGENEKGTRTVVIQGQL